MHAELLHLLLPLLLLPRSTYLVGRSPLHSRDLCSSPAEFACFSQLYCWRYVRTQERRLRIDKIDKFKNKHELVR